MRLPKLGELDTKGKVVIVRGDLDVNFQSLTSNFQNKDQRLESIGKTVQYLFDNGTKKVVVVGHKGRPRGEFSEELSLRALSKYFGQRLQKDTKFVDYDTFRKNDNFTNGDSKLVLLENLRFWKD